MWYRGSLAPSQEILSFFLPLQLGFSPFGTRGSWGRGWGVISQDRALKPPPVGEVSQQLPHRSRKGLSGQMRKSEEE